MSLLIDFFAALPRQGPGSDRCTRRALETLRPQLPPNPLVIDIGCGSGAQTLSLARALPDARITAIDLSAQLLARLRQQAGPLAARIHTLQADMAALPDMADLPPADLIWSEGAIYLIGLETGLRQWRRLLAPGGCLAISHIAWLSPAPARTARDYWQAAYPDIASREHNRETIAAAGYSVLESFALPREAWEQDYYGPMRMALQALPAGAETDALAAELRAEISLFERHGDEYGYIFWLLKPTS